MTKAVLSERLVKSRAAYLGRSLADVGKQAKLGNGYLYRLWNRSNIQLDTINRIANVLECSACDLIEEVEES